jgi:hypothetical protein
LVTQLLMRSLLILKVTLFTKKIKQKGGPK